jgi:hypothetical protein
MSYVYLDRDVSKCILVIDTSVELIETLILRRREYDIFILSWKYSNLNNSLYIHVIKIILAYSKYLHVLKKFHVV